MKPKDGGGVELLRIIAIFLICLYHAITHLTTKSIIDIKQFTIYNFILNILIYSGQIGNLIFIICSAWFLLESKKVKIDKIFKILLDSIIISIVMVLGAVIVDNNFTFGEIIFYIFPEYSGGLWFVIAYILLYSIHPLLNKIIDSLEKKAYFAVCFAFFCTYGLLGFMYEWDLGISSLGKFVIIYLFVGFLKKHCTNFCDNKKWNIAVFFLSFCIFLFIVILKQILPMTTVMSQTASRFYSLLVLFPMVFSLFNIFKSLNIDRRFINYSASCSLFVYCFHQHLLVNYIIKPKYYEYVLAINYNAYFWWILLCGIGMFIGGYLLSIIYKHTISKLTKKLSVKLSKGWERLNNKAYGMFFKDDVTL